LWAIIAIVKNTVIGSCLFALGAALAGCNSGSDSVVPGGEGDFFVSPSNITLATDESVATFQVVGGTEPMTWAVGDANLGSITDTSGRIVNYVRNGNVQGGNEIRVTDDIGLTARALVSQTGDVPGLSIVPELVSMTQSNQIALLTANGGTPPFRWAVVDPSLGSLSSTDTSAVNYMRSGGAEGQNVVELTDMNGTLATAVIVQRPFE
jgi:hypothetical protein